MLLSLKPEHKYGTEDTTGERILGGGVRRESPDCPTGVLRQRDD